ncbi:MAG: MBG domain-containing protein, partial [bacterium]
TGISVSATLAAANFPGSVGGFNTNNYTLPTIASGSVGVITKAPLTATLVPTISKVYDGNATATLGATNYALSGLIGSETSAVNQTAGTYAITNAGTGISVSATLAAANFPGSVGGFNTNNYTLPTIVSGSVGVIKRALDSIIFSNTNHVYNGSEKPVTAIVGSGSAVALTYAGSASVPINVGIYAVTGVVNAANWEATNTTWLTIIKANQSITNFLPADGVQFVFGASTTVVATASSGLPVSFSNLTPAITLMVGNSLTFTNPGVASIQASQAGNSNWNVASSLTHIWRIGGLITNVTPRVANVGGGISVLIQGISLGNGSDITNVTLAGVQAGIVTQTVQSITVLAGAATGAVTGDVSVGSSSGGFMVMSNAFTYLWLDAPVQLDPVDITASNMLARWQTVSNATTHKLDVGLDTNFTAYLPGYHTNDVLMVNQYPVTGLSNSTWYAIRLFAWNSNGYSLPSRTVWVPTGTNTPYEEHVPLPGPVSTGAVTRFALTNMFYGTGLVYTVESSNTNVVSVSIIGGQLEVNPRNPGTATITVHAYNPSTGYTSSYSFLVTVSGPPALVGSSFMARERWNPRYTQVLRVCNNSATDAIGIRVLFTNLYPGITVENRTGTAWDGRPMIEMSTAFPVGSTQDLSIVYLCTGAYPANLYPPAIELQYILPGWNPPLPGAGAAVLTIVPLPGPGERIVLEFESVAGQSYAIEYMNNFSATGIWVQVPLRLRAGANRTQWIDAGPPATQPPAGLRAYQVKRLVE